RAASAVLGPRRRVPLRASAHRTYISRIVFFCDANPHLSDVLPPSTPLRSRHLHQQLIFLEIGTFRLPFSFTCNFNRGRSTEKL
ncbi:unnamed protein product, partial [Musa acuminata var. zebrina]